MEMRSIGPDEVRELAALDGVAFGTPQHAEALTAQAKSLLELERTRVVFDEGRQVATSASLSWELTLPGPATVAAGAVTYVGVLPTHRRRGLLTRMMGSLLDDSRERGEPVSVLLASESIIYSRFGYGLGVTNAAFEIDRRDSAFARPVEVPGRLRVLVDGEATHLLPGVFDEYRRAQPGEVGRSPGWWQGHLADPEWHREGNSSLVHVVHEPAAGLADGYVSYRMKPGDWEHGLAAIELEVEEVVTADPGVRAALWRFVLDVDLVSTVRALASPLDEPLRWMLADPRRMRTVRQSDCLWVRLLDIPTALASRRYAGAPLGHDPGSPKRLVFEVHDPFLAGNGGRYALEAGADGAECARTTADADLRLGVGDLGAAFLGGVRFATLARAGRVAALTPGALARADALFACDPLPFCLTEF